MKKLLKEVMKQRKVVMRQQLKKEVMILQQPQEVKREKKVPLEQLVLERQVQVGMQIQPHLKTWNLTRLRL